MALFTLDTSTLGGSQYRTAPFDMQGEFRDIQFHWSQNLAGEDMEGHYFEFHFLILGVDEVI